MHFAWRDIRGKIPTSAIAGLDLPRQCRFGPRGRAFRIGRKYGGPTTAATWNCAAPEAFSFSVDPS
jgi:hypothetical protein